MGYQFRLAIAVAALIVFSLGCAKKPSFIRQGKYLHENRWAITELNVSKLSQDEAAKYQELGPPDYVRFFDVLKPRREWRVGWLKKGVDATLGRLFERKGAKRPVTVWVYEEEENLLYFVEGKLVDYVAVTD